MKRTWGALLRRFARKQPKAFYEIEIPRELGRDLMVSFVDVDTRLPISVAFMVLPGLVKCSMIPEVRSELRLTWMSQGQLQGRRYALGPSTPYLVRTEIRRSHEDLL
jgi:hypothetical protein